MKIAIGNDHTSVMMKRDIIKYLVSQRIDYVDVGCFNEKSVDYPDYAVKVAHAIINHEADLGILICGTGIGMSIAANRFPEIRAALCYEVTTAALAREHNDANVLATGGWLVANHKAILIVEAFLNNHFDAGRHARRVDKLGDVK